MTADSLSSSGNSLPRRDEPPRRETIIRAPSVTRLDLAGNLVSLLRYRDLLYTLSVHRIKVRYKQTALGILWAILQPLAIMLVFTLVFSYIVKMPSDGVPYSIFVYSALLPWTFFSTALTGGSTGLISHAQLISKVHFPREVLPLTYVVAALFDFIIASSILVVLLVYYQVPLSLNALYAFPVVAVIAMFTTALSLFLSALLVRFRDIGLAMPLVIQVWMFATPVLYPLSAVPGHLRAIYDLNPMATNIENFRRAVLYNAPPDLLSLALSGLVSASLLAVAYIYFKRAEAAMADII